MRVIMISTDKNIWKEGSGVRSRILKYSSFSDEMHVIVFSKRNLGLKPEKIGQKLFIYPTNSFCRPAQITDAFFIAKKILSSNPKEKWLVTTQDPFETGISGYLIKKFFKAKLEVQVHIDFFSPFYRKETLRNKIHFYLGKFILKRSDGIRAVSKKIKNFLVEKFSINENKISVLPIYTNTRSLDKKGTSFSLRERYHQFEFIILMASRLVKQKNIGLAINAFSEILPLYPKAGLIIVGSGPEEADLKKQAKKYSKNIIFEKWSDNLTSYYKPADIFVLSSNYEGWAMTVVEASACGLPVIMTDVGCANEFLFSGKNGVVIPVNDKEALKKNIIFLIENFAKRKKLAESARESALKLPSEEDYLKEIKKSWQNLN